MRLMINFLLGIYGVDFALFLTKKSNLISLACQKHSVSSISSGINLTIILLLYSLSS